MKKAVMYGAGNIGRGFIGELFFESGYAVTFIDINERIINEINFKSAYTVGIVSNESVKEITVSNIRGVIGDTATKVANEIEDCDIMATALGVNALKFVAKNLAEGAKRRIDKKRPLNIIICENLLNADKYLKNLMFEHLSETYKQQFDKYIGLVEASIGRMVPVLENSDDILRVHVEPYAFLPVDKNAFVGIMPDIKGLYAYSPFALFIERKLYMHNMAHAIGAYLGYIKGYKYIYEAFEDAEIMMITYQALVRSARALSQEHGADLHDLLDHAANLLYRFKNRALKDTVARVGRDTIRKLGASDRLSGSIALLSKHNIFCEWQIAGVAAALLFAPGDDINSQEVYRHAERTGAEAALAKYTGLTANQAEQAKELYKYLKSGGTLSGLIDTVLKDENQATII